jgi:hypothetical protein
MRMVVYAAAKTLIMDEHIRHPIKWPAWLPAPQWR